MYFKQFEISNFKGIEHVVFPMSEEGRIYTLVGLNESGKTTILEAMNAFEKMMDEGVEEVLYEDTHRLGDVSDYIPKHKKSNFTGDIRIKATIALEDSDKKALEKYMYSEHDFSLNIDKLGDEFSVTKVFKFEDSEFKNIRNLWDINTSGKKKRAKIEREIGAGNDLWMSIVSYLRKGFPSISYFPTFLFDFPERIYLEEVDNETKHNKYYRTIIQDILNSLDEGLDVQKHIVDRVKEDRQGGGFWFNPFLYNGNRTTKDTIDSVISKIEGKVTDVVFKTWNEVFSRKLENKSVRISFGVEEESSNSEQKVYLEFYIKDGTSSFSITERSLGFRWFFCFLLFTQFRGFRKDNKAALFLFDEPASNLHSKAQTQLLNSFPKITDKGCSVVYSTHSHHLINPKWLENTFIVQNLAIDYDNDEDMGSAPHTDIEMDRYRTFVGKNPDKGTYFQPILEKLEYKPSKLENIPDVIMFEGKHDYYSFAYFDEIIFKSKYDLNYMPGTGASNKDSLIALYKSWGRDFIILLDADEAGYKAKDYYIDEWFLSDNQVFTLSDIDENWEGYSIEKLFSSEFRQEIAGEKAIKNPSKCKKAIARFIQEKILNEEVYAFDKVTLENFEKAISFCSDKINKLPRVDNDNEKVVEDKVS